MYLVEVDDGLPELVLQLVEVPHTNLTEVTGMVLIRPMSVSLLLLVRFTGRFVGGFYRRTLSMLVRWWC
jgi:hypothetical protein